MRRGVIGGGRCEAVYEYKDADKKNILEDPTRGDCAQRIYKLTLAEQWLSSCNSSNDNSTSTLFMILWYFDVP